MIGKVQKRVCVIGLGYIGLPTACVLADHGYDVHGVDIDDRLIAKLQSAHFDSPEPNLQELFLKAINNKLFIVSTQIAQAEIYIIAVPTPLSLDNQPDLSNVNQAIAALKPYLSANTLVLIESTCPIGTTEIIAQNLQNDYPGISVAYCPERVLPGNILYELLHNDRIVGGVNDTATSLAVAFYKSFIKGEVVGTNVRIAEAVKLAENSYRDVNIAFANELSMLADHNNFDVNEVIKLANRHPRVRILDPGPGVGGHCIPVDPWFLASSAPGIATITSTARGVNTRKTTWVIQKIKDAIRANNTKVIACLGLTYKPEVSDIRNSPAMIVIKALQKEAKILCVDPYVPDTSSLNEALANAEMVVGFVAHNLFKNISSDKLAGKILLDFAGVFK